VNIRLRYLRVLPKCKRSFGVVFDKHILVMSSQRGGKKADCDRGDLSGSEDWNANDRVGGQGGPRSAPKVSSDMSRPPLTSGA